MKLTSPTDATSAGTERGADATDNGNTNKSRIKMEQIASSENKGDARNETNGRRGREEGAERANEKYLPKHILLHFRTVFMFILYGDLPPSLLL